MIDWAEPYFGKPFEAHGRGPYAYDCWGLVEAVYRDMGIQLPDYRKGVTDVYNVRQTGPIFDSRKTDFQRVETPQQRDVVLLRRGRIPAHVGLWVDHNVMLHVEEGCHVCFERLDGLLWQGKVLGFYRWT